jgi:hypothetical protein
MVTISENEDFGFQNRTKFMKEILDFMARTEHNSSFRQRLRVFFAVRIDPIPWRIELDISDFSDAITC